MSEKQINVKEKTKFSFIGMLFFIAMVVFFFRVQKCSSDRNMLKFADRELSEKGYEVNDINLTKSNTSIRIKSSTGNVEFKVSDKEGNSYEGKGSIGGERKHLIIRKRVFIIDELEAL